MAGLRGVAGGIGHPSCQGATRPIRLWPRSFSALSAWSPRSLSTSRPSSRTRRTGLGRSRLGSSMFRLPKCGAPEPAPARHAARTGRHVLVTTCALSWSCAQRRAAFERVLQMSAGCTALCRKGPCDPPAEGGPILGLSQPSRAGLGPPAVDLVPTIFSSAARVRVSELAPCLPVDGLVTLSSVARIKVASTCLTRPRRRPPAGRQTPRLATAAACRHPSSDGRHCGSHDLRKDG